MPILSPLDSLSTPLVRRARITVEVTMIQLRFPIVLLSLAVAGLPCLVAYAEQPAEHSEQLRLIEDLGHDQYHRRQAAKRELSQLAEAGRADALSEGLGHPSLEVRSSVFEILLMVRQLEFVHDLDQLSNPNFPTDRLTSVGWKQFARVAGTDMDARLAFAEICRHHPAAFGSITFIESAKAEFTNPFQISIDDHVGWMALLATQLIELNQADQEDSLSNRSFTGKFDTATATQVCRIATSLSQPSMGLNLHVDGNRATWQGLVFSRIVSRWINRHHSIIDPRTTMRVAARYHCDKVAFHIAKRILDDPASAAAAKVTALLTLSKLDRQGSIQVSKNDLKSCSTDGRNAHVWQAISDRKIKIQTQVRDVAIALMLDQAGQDPRNFGFTYLEADPLLRFRDSSLGFENDQLRTTAHAKASKFLGIVR